MNLDGRIREAETRLFARGGLVSGVARRPVIGAENVARLLLGVAAKHPAFPWTRRVNGATGVVFERSDGIAGVMAFAVDGGRITEIDFVVNPEKLSRVPLPSRSEPSRTYADDIGGS